HAGAGARSHLVSTIIYDRDLAERPWQQDGLDAAEGRGPFRTEGPRHEQIRLAHARRESRRGRVRARPTTAHARHRPRPPRLVVHAPRRRTTMSEPNLSAFIWSVADLLRGDYKQSEYGKVILPFTVLRRLDCVLE